MNDKLCLFPYYGGKARLSYEIAGIVESYKKASIYIEPFGGAASVLLNKAPHNREIYNEQSPGMCTLIELLSNREAGCELIDYIYRNTDYSLECFEESLDYRNRCEDNYWDDLWRKMKSLAYTIDRTVPGVDLKKLEEIKQSPATITFSYRAVFEQDKGLVRKLTKKQIEKINKYDSEMIDIERFYHRKEYFEGFDRLADKGEPHHKNRVEKRLTEFQIKISRLTGKTVQAVLNDESYKKYEKDIWDKWEKRGRFRELAENKRYHLDLYDMKLAASTYVVYKQSRNGMGLKFRGYDYDNDFNYKKGIIKLYDIMERLQGVEVQRGDAIGFFREDFMVYMNDPSVIIYADPSYLKQGSGESKANSAGSMTIKEAIEQLKKKEYNPGRVYKQSWTRDEHEFFLRKIQNAKCKIVVSNYRDEENLYDRYLNAANGWSYTEFETKTTVSQNAADRTEVLWYNF